MGLSNKLFAIQSLRLKVYKDKENPFLKSRYAGLANINETLLPFLTEHKLLVSFSHKVDRLGNQSSILEIEDIETGEIKTSVLKVKDTTIQELGSTITYARRYLLLSAFNLDTTDDLDDDGSSSTLISTKTTNWLSVGSPQWQNLIKKINEAKKSGKALTLDDIKSTYKAAGIGVSNEVSNEILKLLK